MHTYLFEHINNGRAEGGATKFLCIEASDKPQLPAPREEFSECAAVAELKLAGVEDEILEEKTVHIFQMVLTQKLSTVFGSMLPN
jgi:hypothetical protein